MPTNGNFGNFAGACQLRDLLSNAIAFNLSTICSPSYYDTLRCLKNNYVTLMDKTKIYIYI